MKTSGRVMSCCVALLLVLLSSVSAVQKLNSITGLKKISFGQSVPKHSLILLHWFANTVDIDNNGIWLTFDPNREDYGSHHYGNFEGLLDPLPRGYRYYTVGNLNQDMTSRQLPSYVVNPPTEYEGRNRDRIIFRVQEQNTGWRALRRIDQVFITQHYETSENLGTRYDPHHTYQITINLLRQIREFSVREGQRPLLHLINRFGSNADDSYIRHTWGKLACLGLLLFIVIEEKYSSTPQRNNRPNMNNTYKNNRRPENNYRWEDNNRRENNNRRVNNNRQENNDQTIINIGSENRAENSRCGRPCLVSFLIFVLVLLVIILSSYFATR